MKQSPAPFRSTWKGRDRCPYKAALDVVGGRWLGLLIWRLSVEPLRTGELRRLIPDITQKMLTQQLRSLEDESITQSLLLPNLDLDLFTRCVNMLDQKVAVKEFRNIIRATQLK